MDKIFLKDADGTPQFGCTSCYKCSSIFGKSLCKIKNRGCCWYFPKFTLYDIQKMVRTTEGIETLNMILKLPNVKIYNYYIHAVGSFDKDSYDKYIDDSCTSHLNYASAEDIQEVRNAIISEQEEYLLYEEYNKYDLAAKKNLHKPRVINDVSMFFRTCPFVIEGKGCSLNEKFRTYVCNFFICDEITDSLINNDEFKKYRKERDNYVRWIEWENSSLESILSHNRVNLIDNFDEVISILKETEFDEYEFPSLNEIELA